MGNDISCKRLAFAIDFWSKGSMEAYFLEHEGYFGALGTFLQSAFGSDVDDVLFPKEAKGEKVEASEDALDHIDKNITGLLTQLKLPSFSVPSTRRVKSSQQSKSAKSTRNRTASADIFRNLSVVDGEDGSNYLRCTDDTGGALSSGILRRRSISESEVE